MQDGHARDGYKIVQVTIDIDRGYHGELFRGILRSQHSRACCRGEEVCKEHAGNMLVASKAPSFTEFHKKGEALLGHAESLLNLDKNP